MANAEVVTQSSRIPPDFISRKREIDRKLLELCEKVQHPAATISSCYNSVFSLTSLELGVHVRLDFGTTRRVGCGSTRDNTTLRPSQHLRMASSWRHPYCPVSHTERFRFGGASHRLNARLSAAVSIFSLFLAGTRSSTRTANCRILRCTYSMLALYDSDVVYWRPSYRVTWKRIGRQQQNCIEPRRSSRT